MPPKKKAAAAPAAMKRTNSDVIKELKTSAKKQKTGSAPVDSLCPHASTGKVHEDYDCMLNQTNIGANNNKFYVIQVVEAGGKFYAWNRWGRVGEPGQNSLKGPCSQADAIKDFEKKFSDKTKNKWAARANFTPAAGKYTLIEIDHSASAADAEKKLADAPPAGASAAPAPSAVEYAECTLAKPTQSLMELIFDKEMFTSAMSAFEIDVKKMPLGAITKAGLAKGYEALVELQAAVAAKQNSKIEQLTSKFYTLIPHSFGRQRPPIINSAEAVQKKIDMLNVLGDIEIAQNLTGGKSKKAKAKKKTTLEEHPLDKSYETLNCDVEPLDPKSAEYKAIIKNLEATSNGRFKQKDVLDIFSLDRHDEGDRFKAHDKIKERKLLWHGTNVAVVAAILSTGMRIMPHSGGRVGKGIYLASENAKSAGYTCPSYNNKQRGAAIMFLAEAALGKEHHITRDDPSLKAAPSGFDSIVAKGRQEPDPKADTSLTLDGKKVIVPQGKPIETKEAKTGTNFHQSEYLVYKESQVRLRYAIKLKFY